MDHEQNLSNLHHLLKEQTQFAIAHLARRGFTAEWWIDEYAGTGGRAYVYSREVVPNTYGHPRAEMTIAVNDELTGIHIWRSANLK